MSFAFSLLVILRLFFSFANNSLSFVEEGFAGWAESSVTAQSKNYSQVEKDDWKEHYSLPKAHKMNIK